jgi:hypothetical protein
MITDENRTEPARNGLKRCWEGLEARDHSESPSQSGEAQRSAAGPIRHTRKTSGYRRGSRTPLVDISQQFQVLAGNVQQAIDQQVQGQQQTRQNELEVIWTRLLGELQKRDAQQQARDEQYQVRISQLEAEVQSLQEQLAKACQTPNTQQDGLCRPLEDTMRTGTQRPDKAMPKTAIPVPKPQEKKTATYADMAALLATKPGGKEWQTVPAKQKQVRKVKELTPVAGQEKEARRLIFRREERQETQTADRADLILALNQALLEEGLPSFVRIVDANYTATGAVSALLQNGAVSSMLLPRYRDLLLAAARKADQTIIAVEASEQWYRVKVHGVPTRRYLTLGLGMARQEIETGGELRLKRDPVWLRGIQAVASSNRKGSTIVITVGSLEEARNLRVNGIRFGGSRFRTEHYWELGLDTICPKCCGIGHRSFRACGDRPPKCYICAGPHEGADHTCTVTTCTAKAGRECVHMPAKCGNCGKAHPATWTGCSKRRSARSKSGRLQETPGALGTDRQTQELEELSRSQGTREKAATLSSPDSTAVLSQSNTRLRSTSAPLSPLNPQDQTAMDVTTPVGTVVLRSNPPGLEC